MAQTQGIEFESARHERQQKLIRFITVGLFVLLCATRFLYLGSVPGAGGLHQDESALGYEAWSLVNYGIDSAGNSWPLYFETWGTGMNACYIYLVAPLVAAFGPTPFVLRLPQAIFSLLCGFCFWKLGNRAQGKHFGLWLLFWFCVMPWAIVSARLAIESFMLPGFLLMASYFVDKAADDARWLYMAALCWAGAAYSYSATWLLLPCIVIAQLSIQLLGHKITKTSHLIGSLALLFMLVFPLFLFILVNLGVMEEFSLGPCWICRLSSFRTQDLSMSFNDRILEFRISLSLLWGGHSEAWHSWHVVYGFGAFYRAFAYIGILGGLFAASSAVRSRIKPSEHGDSCALQESHSSSDALMFVLLFAALGQLFITDRIFPHQNMLYVPVTYFVARGSCLPLGSHNQGASTLQRAASYVSAVTQVLLVVLVSWTFVSFTRYYFGESYAHDLTNTRPDAEAAYSFNSSSAGLTDALEFAHTQLDTTRNKPSAQGATHDVAADKIGLVNMAHYHVLLSERYPTYQFIKEQQMAWQANIHNEQAYLHAQSFGDFVFADSLDGFETSCAVYIVHSSNSDAHAALTDEGYNARTFECYTVFSL